MLLLRPLALICNLAYLDRVAPPELAPGALPTPEEGEALPRIFLFLDLLFLLVGFGCCRLGAHEDYEKLRDWFPEDEYNGLLLMLMFLLQKLQDIRYGSYACQLKLLPAPD